MTDSLLLVFWLALDNAELVVHACLFAVAAISWLAAGALGLFLIWLFN